MDVWSPFVTMITLVTPSLFLYVPLGEKQELVLVCQIATAAQCLTRKVHGRGGVDAPAEGLQGVARQSKQCIHVAVVEVGQQLLGLLLHHRHQVLLLPPPHQGGGGANAGRRQESVPGEEASFGASLVLDRDG